MNRLPSITSSRTRRHVAAAALALLAGTAFAQATAPASAPRAPGSAAQRMGPGGMHGEMHEKHARFGRGDPAAMQKRFDQRMAELKQSLQLTPAQEPAWTEFTNAVRPPSTPPQFPDRAAMEKLSTPQRLDQMQALRKQHQEQMDKREAATRAFYARLSPEQQKRFDAQTARMMKDHEGRGRMGDRHGQDEHHEHRHHG